MMNYDEINGIDYAEEIIEAIEKDYGRSVYRIPKFNRTGPHCFAITMIFTDYRMFEGEIKISLLYGESIITLDGVYY